MDIVDPRIDSYLHEITGTSPSPLDEMEAYAKDNGFPMIGPLVGKFLQQLVLATGAKRIFELGSGYGYSALWMAMAMHEDGRIICTDGKDDNRKLALDFFMKAGQQNKLDFRVGDAVEHLESEDGPFDIILNDIDKHGYPQTLEPVKKRMHTGSIFVTDNVLWSGRIFDENPDESTKGVLEFTKMLYADSDLITTIMPVRDGIAIAVKK